MLKDHYVLSEQDVLQTALPNNVSALSKYISIYVSVYVCKNHQV